jgi:hypothetical protein
MVVVVCVLVLQVQLVWMASVFVNRIVVERIVEMMGVVVLVVLVLLIKFVEMVSVCASPNVTVRIVEMMGVVVLAVLARRVKLASMENAFVCLIALQLLQLSVDKMMVVGVSVLALEGIV